MRRNWFVAAIVIGITSIAVAALIMRLTADDEQTSPTAWADSVCTSLSTWRSSITAISDAGGEQLTAESLQESLADATTATETLVDELKELGPPDLDSGDALKQQLDSSADEIEASFETLKQGAEDAAERELACRLPARNWLRWRRSSRHCSTRSRQPSTTSRTRTSQRTRRRSYRTRSRVPRRASSSKLTVKNARIRSRGLARRPKAAATISP